MLILEASWLDQVISFLQSQEGRVVFIPLYALWITCLLPGVWASMLAGALYGPWVGSFVVFLGACLGAELAFLLGRTLCRNWVLHQLSKVSKLRAIEQAVSREGLKLVLLTRLSPAFPFSILNFIYGVTEVSIKDYTIGLVGIFPGTLLFCGLGSIAGDIANFRDVLSSNDANPGSLILRIVGIIATIGTVLIISRSIRISLQEEDLS